MLEMKWGLWGLRMTTTALGNNVILTHQKAIFTLSFQESMYKWTKQPKELSIARVNHVQVLVPASTIQC